MSNVPLFVWPVGPIINTEPIRYVVNKADHDLVVDALREQNRVLRQALLKVKPELYCMDKQLIASGYKRGASVADAMRSLEAALTATSQPVPPYKEWCRHPEKCAGLASCPQDPTCAD